MKALIKLLIAAAAIHACFRGGQAAWRYYAFQDATQQIVLFGGSQTPAQLHDEIVTRAREFELPVTVDDVEVTREGARTVAAVSYTDAVELLPRYERPFALSFTVEARSVNGTTTAR